LSTTGLPYLVLILALSLIPFLLGLDFSRVWINELLDLDRFRRLFEPPRTALEFRKGIFILGILRRIRFRTRRPFIAVIGTFFRIRFFI
jgi:hypothetical protein